MSLRNRAFSAVRWTTIATAGKALAAFVQLIVLARLLEPKDFGLFALVLAVVNTAQIVSDFGISNAIIHFDDVKKRELSSLYWLNMGMGIALAALLALSGPLLAWFFDEPELTGLISVASLFFIISAIGQQYRALAEKQLQFRLLAIIEIGAFTIGLGITISLAYLHFGAISIVLGFLATAFINSVLVWLLLSSDWRPAMAFHWSDVQRFWRYGSQIVAVNVINTLTLQSDVVVGGRFFDSAALGLYTQPREFALRIMFAINPIITRVAFPLIALAKDDIARVKTIYLSTLRMTTSINFPIYVALAVLAPEFVLIAFGEKWLPSGELLRWLALWCAARSVGNPSGSLMFALGRTRLAFVSSTCNLIGLTAAGLVGVQYGPTGLAISAFAFYALTIPLFWYFVIRPTCHATFAEYHRQLAIPAFNALLAAIAAYFAIQGFTEPLPRLLIGLTAGGLSYVAASAITNRDWIFGMLSVIKTKKIA